MNYYKIYIDKKYGVGINLLQVKSRRNREADMLVKPFVGTKCINFAKNRIIFAFGLFFSLKSIII